MTQGDIEYEAGYKMGEELYLWTPLKLGRVFIYSLNIKYSALPNSPTDNIQRVISHVEIILGNYTDLYQMDGPRLSKTLYDPERHILARSIEELKEKLIKTLNDKV